MQQKISQRFWVLAIALLLCLKVSEQFGHDDDEDISHHGKDPRKYNFAALTSGAELIDYSPKNGKGFKHLLSDDRDKYALFNCNEKKWVIIGLSEDVLIESIVIASYERYSSIVKDFQVLAAVSFPQSNWIDLGNYTAEARLGEQVFHVLQPSNVHTRFVRIRLFNHNFNEDLCTMSQIKVYGKTIYETIKTGMESMFTEDANKASDETADATTPNDTVADPISRESIQGNRVDESNSSENEMQGTAGSIQEQRVVNDAVSSSSQGERTDNEPSCDVGSTGADLLASINETTLPEDSIPVREDSTGNNTNDDLVKEKDQDNSNLNDLNNSAIGSSSAIFEADPERKSFNDAEWKLINDAFNRFNVTEPLYAKMIRRVTEFFINPLNPLGKALNRSNLDSFFADFGDGVQIINEQYRSAVDTNLQTQQTESASELQPTQRTEQSNGVSLEETKDEEKTEIAEAAVQPVVVESAATNDFGTSSSALEEKSKVNSETSLNAHSGEIKDSSSTETSFSTNTSDSPSATPGEAEIKPSSSPVESKENLTALTSTGNGIAAENKSSTHKVAIPDSSDTSTISIVAGTVPNPPIDCLAVLKFAEFRKKRLKEEKENNGNQQENDKANVFNKLFIRIKSIETNEDTIGYFFDEVIKCFQSESQMTKNNMDLMNKELSQLQEKMIEINKFILNHQETQQLDEKRQQERREKWQEQFLHHFSNTAAATSSPSKVDSSHKLSPSSPHSLTLAPFFPSNEDEEYYQRYFQQLFAASNDSNVQITSSISPSTASSRSFFQKGFAGFLKSLMQSTIQLFHSSSFRAEEDAVVESLSNVWSKLYAWSHFHTSDMMIVMLMLMSLMVIMMMGLSFILIVSLLFNQRK